ncbi:MAG: hypothetical protein LBN39_09705 [Planctomycetaceae bacterium]|jgi:hypothetical protein|nr:hypothetical protein [Planctomycetaceae bacterium]
MLTNKRTVLLFVLFIFALLPEPVPGQVLRRALQRLADNIERQENRRVAPADRPLLEQVQTVVNTFANQGNTALKPVAVISLASFENYKQVLQTVARQNRLNNRSTEEPALLNAFLGIYEQIVNRGFDTKQPMGLLLLTDGLLYYPLLFTPLDLDSQFGQTFLNDYAKQLPDGRYVLQPEKIHWALGQLYVQKQNGWAFIAPEGLLKSLPNDPTVLLQKLDKKHLAAAKFDLLNLPALSTRAALALGEMSAAAKAETEWDKAAARLTFGYLRSVAEQADVLEYTLSYDEQNNDYVIEQKESVKPKTERAKLLQQRRDAVSIFHGFYRPDGAVLASHLVMDLTQYQQKELEKMLYESVGRHLLPVNGGTRPADDRSAAVSAGQPVEKEPADPRDKLAALLALASEEVKNEELFRRAAPPPVLVASPSSVLQKIGTAYYWALVEAIRSGHFDGASTWSREHGLFGAFQITDGKQFGEAFDAIFAEVREKLPEFYRENIEKDFADSHGFRLTSITFNTGTVLNEAVKNPFLQSIIPADWSQRKIRLILGVRSDAVCYAFGEGSVPEGQIADALAETERAKPVDSMFFVFSGYELGQAVTAAGNPERLSRLKAIAASTDPKARAYAVSSFTDTSKTITLRISGLLTPPLWKLRNP